MEKIYKLTESALYDLVRESVRQLIKEYGDEKETREKMGRAAKRGVERGDSSAHENAISSLLKRRSSKEELNDFQRGFEGE
jgi:Arc/MetJ-type ribon-helix-helix transcriptional regulator